MAESPSHKFGQMVGNVLEELLQPVLVTFCAERGLYLDRHGARTDGKRVSWEDKYGNSHDLDFVIEKDGSPDKRGRPVAFIEAAWRRYTKHSRAKAQEIQGAILPIAEKYERDMPFLGAVLAGIFTEGSLEQLKSVGFHVVYLRYESIVDAFAAVDIDARFDEKTADALFSKCTTKINALRPRERHKLKKHLLDANKQEFHNFFTRLRKKLDRLIENVTVVPLFGNNTSFTSIEEAIRFIENFKITNGTGPFQKFEVVVTYSNKDEIKGTFSSKERVKEFLEYLSS